MSKITPFQRLLAIIYDCGGSPRLRQYFEEIKKLMPQIQPNNKEETIAHGCLLSLANSKIIPDELLKDLLALLISKGADMNYKDSIGNLLHCLIRSKHFELFQTYIEKGIDVNAQAISGSTPLHTAVKENQPQFVEYLLNHPKTDLSLKDKEGRTAQDLITKETDETIKQAFGEWERQQLWHTQPTSPQLVHKLGVFSGHSSSVDYGVQTKTMTKRHQQALYNLIPQEEPNEQSTKRIASPPSWLNTICMKLGF
jgi:hypothetical protein